MELAEAPSIDADIFYLIELEDIFEICPGLLSLTVTTPRAEKSCYKYAFVINPPVKELQVISWHPSMKEFVLSDAAKYTIPFFDFSERAAHQDIVTACIKYLLSIVELLIIDWTVFEEYPSCR